VHVQACRRAPKKKHPHFLKQVRGRTGKAMAFSVDCSEALETVSAKEVETFAAEATSNKADGSVSGGKSR